MKPLTTTNDIRNRYSPYLKAFHSEGMSADIFKQCIMVGHNNKNTLIDFEFKQPDWKGLVLSVDSPSDAVRKVKEL